MGHNYQTRPKQQGLYDPRFEHDSCGVGFVCNIRGQKSHAIIDQGLETLIHLQHRGAVGADPLTGDGAGILMQVPHAFLVKAAKEAGITLPGEGEYGVGLVFLPQNESDRKACKKIFETYITEEGQTLLGWRDVPQMSEHIGVTARAAEPVIEQVFVGRANDLDDKLAFERKLYVIRKRVEHEIENSSLAQKEFFYVTNLSCRTLEYKGMLISDQVEDYFPDLKDEAMESALCLVHSRYSTNTFPAWDLAQPFRFLAHNGEINTLRGNANFMNAREGLLKSPLFGDDIKKICPVIVPDKSDSATLDHVFELLSLSGRSLEHAMMMLIPAAWETDIFLDEHVRDFYKYHACLMEPWDGPAGISFTDGTSIGAVLDRNGLRPARYLLTKDDMVVMSSEVGVLDIPHDRILYSGRIEPGKIFLVNTEEGRIIDDATLKTRMANAKPYGEWLKQNLVDVDDLEAGEDAKEYSEDEAFTLMKAFGYSREDMKVLIGPMAETGKEPTGAMGNDVPHAVLSKNPQQLYTYFKQLFAQVTNPAIDPIREEIVMSYEMYIGPEQNVLDETPLHARRLRVQGPVLTNERLEKIRALSEKGLKTKTISILYTAEQEGAMRKELERVCAEAEAAINDGYSFIILSDRGVTKEMAAIPALLAVGAVHQHLVRKTMRTRVGLVLESGEPREIHHYAVLFGFGADSVNPYIAFEAVRRLIDLDLLGGSYEDAEKNYLNAIEKGIYKILSKMGISTLRSYRGAQIFEAIGVHKEVIDMCFTNTTSRVGGVTFDIIEKETTMRHLTAYTERADYSSIHILPAGGLYQWKRDGEFHLWNPASIAALQDAARKGDYGRYKEFAEMINDQSAQPTTLRSLLRFKGDRKPISIDEVCPKEDIYKRFATGAMSFGSISAGAHESLAIIMNRLGGRSNTGEGGEDPARFTPLPNGDSKRSAVKQAASGRFGVTTNYLVNADEIQIKIAQGAKPGEGGQLPGHKVSAIIARTRYTTPGVTLISPPPHHDIYSIEDLAQLIFDLKNTNPAARISVKLVSEAGVGTVAAGVAKGHADMILISSGDGGTGASPLSSLKHAGLPWELGLSETNQTLVLNDLRSRVRLQTDGQMRTGRDVVLAALLGAEEYGFCTSALIILGCVMLRHCHLNNCSVGIATQDDILQSRFRGKIEYGMNYFSFIAEEVRELMAELGFRTIDEMVGRCDTLEMNKDIIPWKAQHLDLSGIIYKPEVDTSIGTFKTKEQDHAIDEVLDRKILTMCTDAIDNEKPIEIETPIENRNRTVGAMVSGAICKKHGDLGLPEDTIRIRFQGEAGQSFGAWLAKGVTFELEGLANDYIGKGISGGKIIVYPSKKATYVPEENIIIGNTTFYGAIRGEAYIRGLAGERFCIRNSGLNTVVEGVGDHGCEYMTGGHVVILGKTGRNFAAGMSGGIAYVYDEDGLFHKRCNLDMVELEEVNDEDSATIHTLLHNHYTYTGSPLAQKVLENYKDMLGAFVKVMPIEYKRILEIQKMQKNLEVSDG